MVRLKVHLRRFAPFAPFCAVAKCVKDEVESSFAPFALFCAVAMWVKYVVAE